MPAIQNGSAAVTNGSAVVYHVWNLLVTGYSTIVAGDLLTWPGGGGGVFYNYDPATSLVKISRIGGPEPIAGTLLTGAFGGSATVVQNGPGTPGKWNLGSIGSNPVYFHRAGSGLFFQVSAFNATDRLTLTTPYTDPTESEVGYAITQDYTVNYGLPIVQVGDVDALSVLSLFITTVDSLVLKLAKGELAQLPTTNPGIAGRLWNDSGTVKVS